MTLAGCPLEERISEFHKLRAEGWPIGALAMICVDNPMVAATGHRICNDCMKSCIYQKQDPVDIPQSETRMLKDVLALPWGFEIYSLLTRWNPLNLRRPVPLRARRGKRVLVVGMGPAGFTLAHHLLNDGHTVVGIDGLKIEPLDPALSGVTTAGERVPFAPIRDVATLIEPLDDRVMAGFGGVAEYGITVRWDKNFLKVIRLLLERRDALRAVRRRALRRHARRREARSRSASTTSRSPPAPAGRRCSTCRTASRNGVRTASDFLMALQLTGAAKTRFDRQHAGAAAGRRRRRRPDRDRHRDRVARLLPGAGREIPGALRSARARRRGAPPSKRRGRPTSALIAEEFLAHARAIRAERAARAARRARAARSSSCCSAWGGVDDRLSPAADRQPVVHAQSRGSREGAGGGHPLRRRPDAARDRSRRSGRMRSA